MSYAERERLRVGALAGMQTRYEISTLEDEFDIEELELEGAGLDAAADQGLYEHYRIDVDRGQEPLRVDKFLTEHMPHVTRNRIQLAADAGFVFYLNVSTYFICLDY